jgi:hypothetical protein
LELQQPTALEDMGKPRHKLHGKRGPFLEVVGKSGVTNNYIWQRSGGKIIRGSDRKGIKAKDFATEAVRSNELTSPKFEVPRVVIETMRFDIKTLNAQDVAIYWRLFAEARFRGIADETHTITMTALKGYLDSPQRARIIASMEKLTTVSMSIRVNQADAHGRVSMPMIEAVEVSKDTVTFRLPTVLRNAVLASRDYAWIDLNAIQRFESKFTVAVYLKLCYEAGKHHSRRSGVAESRDAFRARMQMPEGTKDNTLDGVIARVKADLLAIDGPRRRFDLKFTAEHRGDIRIEVGTAARALKEVKPKTMTLKAVFEIVEANKGVLAIPQARDASITRFRQAATLLDAPVRYVADKWRLDVYGAAAYPDQAFVGLFGRDFIRMIDEFGADDMLEYWLDKRDFKELGGVRKVEDVGVAKPRKAEKVVAEVAEPQVVEADVEEDVVATGHFDDHDYGMPEFKAPTDFADHDDADIPF